LSLSAGSTSVAPDGSATGDGLSKAIYDSSLVAPSMAAVLANTSTDPATGIPFIPEATKLTLRQGLAEQANATATAVISYFLANTVLAGIAHVSNERLGALPSALVAGTPIDPPAAAVDVPVTGGIS
jgi:hypothetical protein